MKRLVSGLLAACLLVQLLLVNAIPVLAAGPRLSVSGALLEWDLNPGESYVHTIGLTAPSAMDVSINLAGLGHALDGGIDPLTPQEDTGLFTARPFISLNKTSLHLEPDVKQEVKATISLPAGIAPGERYADVFIMQADTDSEGVGVLVGTNIPIIIKTPGYTPVRTGSITGLSIPTTYTGKTLDIKTTFNNTGNCRITSAKNKVRIKDSSNNIKWQNEIEISSPSLLPNFPRLMDIKNNTGLNTGSYTLTSEITQADGTLLDTRTINFTVVEPPPIPAAPNLTSPGNSTVPGPAIDTLTPTFQWSTVSSADYYILKISRSPYGDSDVIYTSDHITGTSLILPADFLFAGEQYAWQVNAANFSGTSQGSAKFYFQTAGSSPAVTTGQATNIAATGATLNGELNARGNTSSVTVSFEYGTSTSYGNTTASQTKTAAGAFSTDISGLTANTTYYFRAKATGSSTVYGSNITFTTSPTGGPLAVTTTAAGGVTSTGAVLNGNLTSLGSNDSVSVNFEYGTDTSYGNTTSSQTLDDTGAFSSALTGLTANTTYHFRARAVGAYIVYGSDRTFITASATSTPTLTPTPSATPSASNTPPATTSSPATTAPVVRSYKDYFPAVIYEPSLVFQDFSSTQTAYLDSFDENGTEVELSGTNNRGTITIITGMYRDEPQTEVEFSSGPMKGGTGKPWIKFSGVRVEGPTQGTASVTLHYTSAEISEYDPDSLFLSYFSGGSWHKCSNIVISADDQTISGDIPVSRLSGTAIGLGGALLQEAPAGAIADAGDGQPTGNGIPWTLAGIVIATIIIAGGVVLVLEKNRRRSPANS
jgi:hypothetical protein